MIKPNKNSDKSNLDASEVFSKQTKKYNNAKKDKKVNVIASGKTATIGKKELEEVIKNVQVEPIEKPKKKYFLICLNIILLIVFLVLAYFVYKDSKIINIENVQITNFDKTTDEIDIKISFQYKLLQKDFYCFISENEEEPNIHDENWLKQENNTCTFKRPLENYYIYIKDSDNDIATKFYLRDKVQEVFEFETTEDIIYLIPNETKKIDYTLKMLGIQEGVNWNSYNENIININNDTITAISEGQTEVVGTVMDKEIKFNVIVTNLIQAPTINNRKSFLGCNQYSTEQAHLLDNILEYKIEEAEESTRAGVVAAARFLSLEFPYRLNYFLENGRMYYEETDNKNVDGEGRYYHKGLYLSEDKLEGITSSKTGPVIWGCPLRNLNYEGKTQSNGLDCSGFVTWSIVNGGFDVGDLGAGGWEDNGVPDLTTIGEKKEITRSLVYSNKIKAGDLASIPGHIAMIIGVSSDRIYVAEELYLNVGLTVLSFTYDQFVNTSLFTDVVLMDQVYKTDGNYTAMWE